MTGTLAASNALVAASVPRERTGYAMGLLQTALGTGVAVGPLIGGAAADAFGYRAAFYLTAAMLFLAGLLVLFGRRRKIATSTKSPSRRPRPNPPFSPPTRGQG